MIHYITPNGIASAWVANELRIVGEAGIPFRLHSMRASNQKFFASEWARRIDAETNLIYPLPLIGVVVSLLLGPALFGGRFFSALWNALTGEREHVRARLAGIAHFVAACHWARGLQRGEQVSHIHSQWIHSGGTIGMYGAWLLGASFSFTGHAADLFRDRSALRDKIRRAKFIICISEFHRRFFLEEGARPEQLVIAYCGIDVEQMAPRQGPRPEGPFTILSSGRLVEKKGFDRLIDACGKLRERAREFRCVIAGDGPLLESLQRRIAERGLESVVEMTGKPLKQEDIPAFMHTGDVYALPCVWAPDRDVDGLPQMLMEAMACGLPAVSTDLVGIPDLIEDGVTGLLVPTEDVEALAGALERLMDDAELRERLAAAGRQRVLEQFDIQTSLEPLLRQFRERLEASGAAGAPSGRAAAARPAPAEVAP